MKHGRFLATISSATVLASSFCAAVPTDADVPTYDEQVDIALSLLSLAGYSENEINKIVAELKQKANGEKIQTVDLYMKVHQCLKSEKWFSEENGECTVIECNDTTKIILRFWSNEKLADYLLKKHWPGYAGASKHWKDCYNYVMFEVLWAEETWNSMNQK